MHINVAYAVPKRGSEAVKRKSMIPQIDQENKACIVANLVDITIKIGAQVGRRMTWLNKDKNFN